MAWIRAKVDAVQDRWRVTTLLWSVVELLYALLVLLSALSWFAVSKFVRSSGICPSCPCTTYDPEEPDGRRARISRKHTREKDYGYVCGNCSCYASTFFNMNRNDAPDASVGSGSKNGHICCNIIHRKSFHKLYKLDNHSERRRNLSSEVVGFCADTIVRAPDLATCSVRPHKRKYTRTVPLQSIGPSRHLNRDTPDVVGSEGGVIIEDGRDIATSAQEDALARDCPINKSFQIEERLADERATNHRDVSGVSEAGSVPEGYDSEIGVKELREALEAEREALAAVYIELEEERNASATAANEAMAMISRLQEEKAAIQMEARQYERMVEEKAQHDQEDIMMLKEFLVRKDEDKYALEDELWRYRTRLSNMGLLEFHEDEDFSRGSFSPINYSRSSSSRKQRDALLLEGSEEWKSNQFSDIIVGECKDESVAGLKDRMDPVDGRITIESRNDGHVPDCVEDIGKENSRKNLIESFGGANNADRLTDADGAIGPMNAVENEQNQIILGGNEGLKRQREVVIGYDSFKGMMETLRREPSLKDEESVKILQRIEENFQRQTKDSATNGEELGRIWKRTLGSLESAIAGTAEQFPRPILRIQIPSYSQEPDGRGSDGQGLKINRAAVDDSENKAEEEKRLSVLEYVWRFEDQLHQLGKKQPFQFGKTGSANDGRETKQERTAAPSTQVIENDRTGRNGASTSGTKLLNDERLHGGTQPVISLRERREVGDLTIGIRKAELNHFTGKQESCSLKGKLKRSASQDEHEGCDESSLVHDVYEVRNGIMEVSQDADCGKFPGVRSNCSQDVQSMNFLSKDQVDGKAEVSGNIEGDSLLTKSSRILSPAIDEPDGGDRLGKPEVLPVYPLQEHEGNLGRNGNGKSRRVEARHGELHSPHGCTILEPEEEWSRNIAANCKLIKLTDEKCGTGMNLTPSMVVTGFSRDKVLEDVENLNDRLRALEADRYTMEQTISSLKRENGEMKLLQEIAEQLRDLRNIEHKIISTPSTWPVETSSVATLPVYTTVPKKPRLWSLSRGKDDGSRSPP